MEILTMAIALCVVMVGVLCIYLSVDNSTSEIKESYY